MVTEDNEKFLVLTNLDTGVRFYHPNDERAFFEWLGRITCIDRYYGDGPRGLVVHLKHRPKKDELQDLIAFFYRYHIDMHQLAKFENTKNRFWFCDPTKYWYDAIFQQSSPLKT